MIDLRQLKPGHWRYLECRFRSDCRCAWRQREAVHAESPKRRAQSKLNDLAKAKLSEVFINLLLQRLKNRPRKEIEAMIGGLANLEETVAGKELMRIGEQRGQKKGKKEGREEGREEGKKEALLILVDARLGKASAPIRKRLCALPADKVEQLLPLVAEWRNMRALQKWLGENAD